MAVRGFRLLRKLGSTSKFVPSVLSAARHDSGAFNCQLRFECTEAASQGSFESSRRQRKAGISNRFTSRKERGGATAEDLSNYRSKRSIGADDVMRTRSRGNIPGDQTGVECAASSSRRVEKRHVYVTSDFSDYRGMQLVFLGTSSSIPTLKRSTSCTALRLEGSIFVFDCGEGTVRQILQTPMKHYDIGNIFVTHMHGDHIYGLPGTLDLNIETAPLPRLEGLLCRLGLKEFQNKEPIQIYGPQGLRQWIRTTLIASHARVHPKYAVHELHLRKKSTNVALSWNYVDENHEDELPGRDIQRSSEGGLWQVLKDDKYTVRAGFLRHSIPCWGYIVEEHTRRGRFDVERARQAGVKPGKFFRMLEAGDSVMLEDGKIVYPSDVLGPPRRGRKVVILGDTCDSKSLLAAAQEADVVVHEATVLEQDAQEVLQRGHSTAKMAGEFARDIKADTLVLTHFSRKLDGALYVDERSSVRETMEDLVSSAQAAFEKDNVIAAKDMMAITVQLEDKPPLKDAQHLTPASEDEEYKPAQRKILRHSSSSEFDEKPSRKDVRSGQSSKSQKENQKLLKNASTRHLSPAQLKDKRVLQKNLPKPSSLSE